MRVKASQAFYAIHESIWPPSDNVIDRLGEFLGCHSHQLGMREGHRFQFEPKSTWCDSHLMNSYMSCSRAAAYMPRPLGPGL